MRTPQQQAPQQQKKEQVTQHEDQEFEGPEMAPPPFQLQASSSAAPSGGKGPIQRKIGPNGDGKRVIKKGAGQTFIARKRPDGKYDLYQILLDGQEILHSTVTANNKHYSVLPRSEQKSGMDLDDVSFTTSQKDRRVYSDSTNKERADYSYSALSHSLDQFDAPPSSSSSGKRRNTPQKRKKMNQSVAHGASLSLSDGRINLNPKLDATLQLVVAHLLKYQQFHTPAELKSASRVAENEWRSHELDQTRQWLQNLGFEALRQMLPRLESDVGTQRLRDIWPASLDIGFPPSESDTIFEYSTNKAVFLMAQKTLLDAFMALKKDKAKTGRPRSKRRKHMTDSFLKTVAEQEEDLFEDGEDFVERTMGLKRSDSGNSLVPMPGDEFDPDLTDSDEYDEEDDLDTAYRRQRAVKNSMALKVKMTNRSLLDDDIELLGAESQEENKAADRARELRRRHLGVQDHLETVHQAKNERLRDRYKSIVRMHDSYQNKRKMLDKLKPEASDKSAMTVWRGYDRRLEVYREEAVGEHIGRDKNSALHGIGPKTVEREMGSGSLPAPPPAASASSSKKKKSKKKSSSSNSKPKSKSPSSGLAPMVDEHEEESKHSGKSKGKKESGMNIHELAAQYGGTAQYGDDDGNNCLIFAIAFAMGVGRFSQRKAAQIRAGLQRQGLIGIDGTGFLPGYGNVVDRILQFLLADQLINGGNAGQLRVTVDSVVPGIAPVHQGAGNRQVTIIHDGIHFWWVKPN